MKNINCTILSVLCIFLFNACSQSGVDNHITGMSLVKFKNQDYLNYVVAEDIPIDLSANPEKNDENGYSNKRAYKIRSIEGVSQDFFIGKSPYIELSDGYYLVDWKWGNFIYKPFNVLLDVLWSEVQDRQQLWDMETPIISSDFIDKWGTTNRSEIDRYLQIEPAANDTLYGVSTDHLRSDFLGRYHSLSDVPEGIKENYIREKERQDSLQCIYVERLKLIIQKGALNKVAYIYNI
ncbi:MAG: hypothetical protein IJQ97_06890 [Paludibacteraceae bacterium]|nr:hypothetical protein [Paludibacteraceae bacterium]